MEIHIEYCDVFFLTGRAVHLHICGQCSWSIDHNTERFRFHGHVVGGIALFYSQTISGRPHKTALLLFGLQHHISSWDNIWLPQSSWFVHRRDMDILIPTKQRQLDAKLKDFTEDSGSTSAFLMCVYSEVFTSSERSFLTVFIPILWYIDVYKEIFVLWHCVIMLFLINSVYIQSVYIHNLFSMMRGFLQYNTRANLRILWSFGVVTQNTHLLLRKHAFIF